jgi:disulfide oxidoreductase YuzD
MTQMIATSDLEDAIKAQVTSFKSGKNYLEIKEQVSKKHDTTTASKIVQEAFRRYKYTKIKKNIIAGFLLTVFAILGSLFDKKDNIYYIVVASISFCFVLYNIYRFYKGFEIEKKN